MRHYTGNSEEGGKTLLNKTAAPSRVANERLADLLDRHAQMGELWQAEGDRVRCIACGHRCLIAADRRGICKVRFNQEGKLRVPFGYVGGMQCDPVEKKPFFHVFPGSDALTFGMMGCDFHCAYCQNWVTSQALRDEASVATIKVISADQIVEVAQRQSARLIVSSYNEPLITAEWAVTVFKKAKPFDLKCAFVSNGNATKEVLNYLLPWLAAYKVDLKSFNDKNYRTLGGTLANITETIQDVHKLGIWLEIVTLLVPGFNDNADELRAMTQFLASLSRDIPWHVTAFHQDYHMTTPPNTTVRHLIKAAEIGAAAGLNYVYAGNLPGSVGSWEDTRCPRCQETLIKRRGYMIQAYNLTPQGNCPRCQNAIPGIWPGNGGAEVKTGQSFADHILRSPRLV